MARSVNSCRSRRLTPYPHLNGVVSSGHLHEHSLPEIIERIMSARVPIHNVAVFCASATGAQPAYQQAAHDLGKALAQQDLALIYGGAKVGLMGIVADSALAAGGRVIGVIPEVLVNLEVAHQGLSELHVTSTMHTRKALIGQRADAFVVMPGGFGTFEELFEVLAWQTLKLHNKPIILLNTAGFYEPMLGFLDHCVREGMMTPAKRSILLVADTVESLVQQLGL